MRSIIFLFLVNACLPPVSAQTLTEIASMRKVQVSLGPPGKTLKINFPVGEKKTPSNQNPERFRALAGNNHNEFQLLFSGLFLFYKFFISSQDAVSCAFHPSCSEYGILSVKKMGIVEGALNSFDRLLRCHGLSPYQYPLDNNTGLLIDFPEKL